MATHVLKTTTALSTTPNTERKGLQKPVKGRLQYVSQVEQQSKQLKNTKMKLTSQLHTLRPPIIKGLGLHVKF